MSRRIAVIGAGPIGLEAAWQAKDRGYPVRIFERGVAGASMRAWGHVRMFSPLAMNTSALGRRGVKLRAGEDEFLTGAEFAEQYLQPLAHGLGDRLVTRARVVGIGRAESLKGDWIGVADRARQPFELLIEQGGREWIEEAEIVLDCSGTYGRSRALGSAGMPVPGERACADFIFHGVPDISGALREQFAGCRVLVIGAGHSAATVVASLADLAEAGSPGEVNWIVRKPLTQPAVVITDDPLPARAALARRVNELAAAPGWLTFHPGKYVRRMKRAGAAVEVELGPEPALLTVDLIVAATGFRPDLSLARELQVSLCYATEGTLPLAARLLGETGGDCLAAGAFGVDALRHPEPGYFALGMKSYGRASDFLIRTGYEQVTSVFDWLEQEAA